MEHKENLLNNPNFKILKEYNLKWQKDNFPSGPVVKNPLSKAGDVGLVTGHGTKIPHATTAECACSLSPFTREALREVFALHCNRRSLHTATKTQNSPKMHKKIKDNERMNLSLVNKITMK